MNWWPGSAAQSSSQAADRNQRAARRQTRNLDLHLSDEEDFQDCDTSLNNKSIFSLDGAADNDSATDSDESPEDTMALTAAQLAAEKAKPVQTANYPDDEDAWKKELKLKFDKSDVQYWFNASESQMKKSGINSQWSKKNAIVAMLPDDVIEECKPILRLTEEDQGDHIYLDLKNEIMKIYGPRDQDVFKKAIALRLTGRPSALGKKLIHILCPGPRPFVGCHCAKIVYGFWEAQLTPPIRTALSGQRFTADTYNTIFEHADEAWLANGGSDVIASPAVVAAASVQSASNPPTESAQASAVSRGRGGGRGGRGGRGNRGNRGGRGGNRGASNNSNSNSNNTNQTQTNPHPHQKGQRAAPDVPDNACSQHWKAGRNATYCSDPLNCDWVRIIAPRAPRQN